MPQSKKWQADLKLPAILALLVLGIAGFLWLSVSTPESEIGKTPQIPQKTAGNDSPLEPAKQAGLPKTGQEQEQNAPQGQIQGGGFDNGSQVGEYELNYEKERQNQENGIAETGTQTTNPKNSNQNDQLTGDDESNACIENCIEAGESQQDCGIICNAESVV